MKKEKSKLITLLVLLFLIVTNLQAQVLVTLHQPPPNQLSVESLWQLDIINNSGKEINIKFRGEVTETNEGLIFEAFSSTFKLATGFKQFNASNIDQIGPFDLSFANTKYQEFIGRTGNVPSGNYTVCIYVIDTDTLQEIASNCIQQKVQQISPPFLISPFDESEVKEQLPVFTWQPSQPLSPQTYVKYTLKMVEVLNNQTAYEAIESNPAWLIAKNITVTILNYPLYARSLEDNKTYAWQVQVLSEDDYPIGENDGKSEVWTFIKSEESPYERDTIFIDFIEPESIPAGVETEVILTGNGLIDEIEITTDYNIDVVKKRLLNSEKFSITLKPLEDIPPGIYSLNFYASPSLNIFPNVIGIIVTQQDCDSLLKILNILKKENDEKATNCDLLEAKLQTLKEKKKDLEQEIQDRTDRINELNGPLDKLKEQLAKANKDFETLIENGTKHDPEISSQPKQGLNNSVGFPGTDVNIHFSGSQESVDKILDFLNTFRDTWNSSRDKCKDLTAKIEEETKKIEAEKEEKKKAETNLQNVEKEIKDTEEALNDCRQKLQDLDLKKEELEKKHKECFERLQEQRITEEKIKNADNSITQANNDIENAEKEISSAKQNADELESDCEVADNLLKEATGQNRKARNNADEAEKTSKDAQNAFNNGDLEKANHLAEKSKELSAGASETANDARRSAKKANREIEWWRDFLRQDNPTPHDIKTGKKGLTIGLGNVLQNYCDEKFVAFEKLTCEDKCLISVTETFRQENVNLLKDLALIVFAGSIHLPATAPLKALIAFEIFKEIIVHTAAHHNHIPLAGEFTYKHPFNRYKNTTIKKFECTFKSLLLYNNDTGYVSGIVICECCGTVQTLYIKYKCDEYGNALQSPPPVIEFR